jgi:hypothetical protein
MKRKRENRGWCQCSFNGNLAWSPSSFVDARQVSELRQCSGRVFNPCYRRESRPRNRNSNELLGSEVHRNTSQQP